MKEMTCQGCGCSDSSACDGGCMWVAARICSRCALESLREAGRHREADLLEPIYEEVQRTLCIECDSGPLVDPTEFAGAARLWRPGDPI
jgi:hypothetical protein